MNLIEKMFGTHSERELKLIYPIAVSYTHLDVYKRQVLSSYGQQQPVLESRIEGAVAQNTGLLFPEKCGTGLGASGIRSR